MIIKYTRQSLRWFKKYNVDEYKLTKSIISLCKAEGKCSGLKMKINIMPRAIDSSYFHMFNILDVAVQSKKSDPRYIKIKRTCRNLLHELRHFIQFRIHKKPFTFSYSMRDMALMNSRYWNDPDEIDARKYERRKLTYLYKKII